MLKRPALGLITGSALITLALATPAAAATTHSAAATHTAAIGSPTAAATTVSSPIASALTGAYASYRHIPASAVTGVRGGHAAHRLRLRHQDPLGHGRLLSLTHSQRQRAAWVPGRRQQRRVHQARHGRLADGRLRQPAPVLLGAAARRSAQHLGLHQPHEL